MSLPYVIPALELLVQTVEVGSGYSFVISVSDLRLYRYSVLKSPIRMSHVVLTILLRTTGRRYIITIVGFVVRLRINTWKELSSFWPMS